MRANFSMFFCSLSNSVFSGPFHVNAVSVSHEHEDTHTSTQPTYTLWQGARRRMHALSLQASQVADIFHFCAYKVIIIILVGVTEQGSVHCHCQPPINIPLLQGNPRSSRNLQFTQLRSMWTKPSILSLSLFFLLLSSTPALHFPITSPLCLLLCVFNTCVFFLLFLFSPLTCLPSPPVFYDLSPLLSTSLLSFTVHLCWWILWWQRGHSSVGYYSNEVMLTACGSRPPFHQVSAVMVTCQIDAHKQTYITYHFIARDAHTQRAWGPSFMCGYECGKNCEML